jgi:NodT family efflux transporter outer membrane factor (OMF) lipoprotein
LGTPLVGAILTVASSGCTVGPDFKSPAAPSTAGYISPREDGVPDTIGGSPGSEQTIAIGAKVTADWWMLFRSPDLDGLIKQAIAGNRTLESARARLAEAQEAVAAASSALYPQVSFNASIAREKESAASFGLTPSEAPLPPNFNLFQFGPTVSYTLDLFGGTRRHIEQEVALADYKRDRLAAAYLSLTGQTVSEVVQLATVRAKQKAVGDILAIDQQSLNLVRRERQAGTVPDSDVVTAESQLATDETLQPGLDQQLSASQHALAVLLGRAPGDWSPPDFDLASLALPSQLPLSLPSSLVHQRPDIQAAEAQLHAASAGIGIATAHLYPDITLSGGISAAALIPGQLFSPGGLVWSIAAGLSQPVFDGGMRQAERRAALASFKASAADYQQTVLQAFGQVADILQSLSHDADLLAAQQRALDMALASVRLQRINYGNGGTGILGLLDAQREYQQALLGYVGAEALRYRDTIQLLVAMGGGWWDTSVTVADVHDSTMEHANDGPANQEVEANHSSQ